PDKKRLTLFNFGKEGFGETAQLVPQKNNPPTKTTRTSVIQNIAKWENYLLWLKDRGLLRLSSLSSFKVLFLISHSVSLSPEESTQIHDLVSRIITAIALDPKRVFISFCPSDPSTAGKTKALLQRWTLSQSHRASAVITWGDQATDAFHTFRSETPAQALSSLSSLQLPHPADILRQPELKREVWDKLKKFDFTNNLDHR
ncbi:MAG: hypothetical protein KA436_03525, partial [Oligoflexales bacterium]|nr:hypothetical protein [Oligoflexales bacterium]